MRKLTAYAATILFAACSAKTIDIGSSGQEGQSNLGPDGGPGAGGNNGWDGGGDADPTPGAGLPQWPTDDTCLTGQQLPVVGTWDGYVESFQFPSGSDAIHLV